MSNRQVAISVSLVTTLLIMGYYLVRLGQIYQQGGLNSEDVFELWAVVIFATIAINIAGNILTLIVLNIIHAIQTNSNKELRIVDDERDRLIALKGTKVAYIASSAGVFFSMLTFVLNQPPLVMFSLIIFFGLVAEILSDLSQFYFYRRGA